MKTTWVGTAEWVRVRRLTVGLLAGLAVLSVLAVLVVAGIASRAGAAGPGMVGYLQVLWVPALVAAVLGLRLWFGRRSMKPVVLTIDASGVTLARGEARNHAAATDILWGEVPLDGGTVVLTQCPDRHGEARPALIIETGSFTTGQWTEILAVLRSTGATPGEVSRRSPTGRHGSLAGAGRGKQPKLDASRRLRSWRARRAVGYRLGGVVVWSLLIFSMAGLTSIAGTESAPPVAAVVVLWLIIGPVALFSAWDIVQRVSAVTLTVGGGAVRLDRRRRSVVIRFGEIESVELRHAISEGIGPNPGMFGTVPMLVINPKPRYWARTGLKPPGPLSVQWKLYRDRFTKEQFEEITAALAGGVKAVGGLYAWMP